MKTKDVIISTAAIMVGVAVTIGAGVAIKNQIDKHLVKPVVCKYDAKLQTAHDGKIIVGMLATSNNGLEPIFASVIAIPPTTCEVDAYLYAMSMFESTNKSAGRNLLSFLPIYADGHIGDYIISSEFIDESKNVENKDYMIRDFAILTDSQKTQNKKIKIIKNPDKVNKQEIFNKIYYKSFFVVYDVVIVGDNLSGNQRKVEKFLDQPINIYDIYNGWDLSKIYTDAYNPLKRVRL